MAFELLLPSQRQRFDLPGEAGTGVEHSISLTWSVTRRSSFGSAPGAFLRSIQRLTNDGKVIFALHLSAGHMQTCLPLCH